MSKRRLISTITHFLPVRLHFSPTAPGLILLYCQPNPFTYSQLMQKGRASYSVNACVSSSLSSLHFTASGGLTRSATSYHPQAETLLKNNLQYAATPTWEVCAYIHTFIHTNIHTFAYIHGYIHTSTHTYKHTYVHISTHVHTYTYICSNSSSHP